eukprot:TRINITY_DN6487_c0_g1_i1.p1 TRINITY_DN6487_c0_g1~~TRINITY_DN6487_c0_g1_i1.p1  ORF type:complete len:101 (-),score=7.79 TRINITY_DN6487_c0_g1_i1:232-534(-)
MTGTPGKVLLIALVMNCIALKTVSELFKEWAAKSPVNKMKSGFFKVELIERRAVCISETGASHPYCPYCTFCCFGNVPGCDSLLHLQYVVGLQDALYKGS